MMRLAGGGDAQAIADIYAPLVRDTVISFELEPPSAREMEARIAKTLAMFPWIVDERDGRIAGYAYASHHRDRAAYQWSADVSCYVRADARRRGIGQGLYAALLKVLRRQGFQNAYAGITLPNEASVRLHESVGFVPLGVYRGVGFKRGAWHDVGWWHRSLGDAPADPTPPRAFPLLGLRVFDQL